MVDVDFYHRAAGDKVLAWLGGLLGLCGTLVYNFFLPTLYYL